MFKKLLCMFDAMSVKQCQSCGMPLRSEKAGDCRGSEIDGKKSEKWCSLCYNNGEFTGKECSLDQMKQIVDDAMKQEKMNWFMRKMALWQLPHLARWKQTDTTIPL